VLEEKPTHVPLRPQRIAKGAEWNRTRVLAWQDGDYRPEPRHGPLLVSPSSSY